MKKGFSFWDKKLPVRTYKILKRLDHEERERAYLWLPYKVNNPNVDFDLLLQGNEQCFPKFTIN